MASLDNPFYAYRVAGSGDADWTIVEVTDGSFPESFTGLGNTEYEVKTKIWSESAFITTGDASFIGLFGTPTVGISLRDLSGTNPTCIRVRRSSDNTLQDFTVTEITDGTLTTFTGANDGFIQTWYNQGSGADFIQNTATRQPKIVTAGVLETENGLPIARRNGVDGGMISTDSLNDATARTFFYVGKNPSQKFALIGSSNGGSDYGYSGESASVSPAVNGVLIPTSQRLNLSAWNPTTRGDTYTGLLNQFLAVIECSFNYTDTGIRLGYRETAPGGAGMVDTQELIIYDGSGNNTAKESNINTYWR